MPQKNGPDFYNKTSLLSFVSRKGAVEGVISYNSYIRKLSKSLIELNKCEIYKTKHKKAMLAARSRMVDRGEILSEKDKPLFEVYSEKVDAYTKFQNLDLLRDIDFRLKRTNYLYAYELDHMISKKDGFINNIPPEVIGHISNLQVIPWQENATKSSNSYCIIEQSRVNYDIIGESYIPKFNFEKHYRERNYE